VKFWDPARVERFPFRRSRASQDGMESGGGARANRPDGLARASGKFAASTRLSPGHVLLSPQPRF